MKRVPWGVLLALLAGLGLGLAYSWVLSPLRVIDSEPIALRGDFKDQYRSAIAAAYAATDNLPRAQARLSLLGDTDPIEALNAQAQRMLASGQSFEQADKVVALAAALSENNNGDMPIPTSTLVVVNNNDNASTATSPPPTTDTSDLLTETPQPIETQAIISESTPRPTQTLIPTLGAPFTLTGQDTICDSNLPIGLLQVMVLNSSRRQLAGMEIVITWDEGEEQFFTGLKPEIGNGYADFIMTPDTTYTVKLGPGSDIASGLTVPTCQAASGESFFGGIKLTFQQP
jgi:hypothetical protein